MSEEKDLSEILKRKYEPVSDWRPARSDTSPLESLKGFFADTLETLEPLSEEAKSKIKTAAEVLEDVAERSSTEARSVLARALEKLAEKVKP